MSVKSYLISQFREPRGPAGKLAGWIMARRPSNRLRNAWTVDLLDLGPADRVLEIGYGPGIALALVAARVGDGRIVGLDHSPTMREQAARRNRAAIADGRVRLLVGAVDDLPEDTPAELKEPFDRIFGVNVAMFWSDPVAVFRRLGSLLARGGMIAITHQPRAGEKTDEAALREAETISNAMLGAGLVEVRIERLTELSPAAVCVIGASDQR
jgi:SAM-dependent methyltransferase